jgi:hypothetical protein
MTVDTYGSINAKTKRSDDVVIGIKNNDGGVCGSAAAQDPLLGGRNHVHISGSPSTEG